MATVQSYAIESNNNQYQCQTPLSKCHDEYSLLHENRRNCCTCIDLKKGFSQSYQVLKKQCYSQTKVSPSPLSCSVQSSLLISRASIKAELLTRMNASSKIDTLVDTDQPSSLLEQLRNRTRDDLGKCSQSFELLKKNSMLQQDRNSKKEKKSETTNITVMSLLFGYADNKSLIQAPEDLNEMLRLFIQRQEQKTQKRQLIATSKLKSASLEALKCTTATLVPSSFSSSVQPNYDLGSKLLSPVNRCFRSSTTTRSTAKADDSTNTTVPDDDSFFSPHLLSLNFDNTSTLSPFPQKPPLTSITVNISSSRIQQLKEQKQLKQSKMENLIREMRETSRSSHLSSCQLQ